MIGVVLWVDQKAQHSIIWCEDQADLAFGMQEIKGGCTRLSQGDLVRFDPGQDGKLRLARNVCVIKSKQAGAQGGVLKQMLQNTVGAGETSQSNVADLRSAPSHNGPDAAGIKNALMRSSLSAEAATEHRLTAADSPANADVIRFPKLSSGG